MRVAIIGAGPTGLFLGAALARRGHRVTAVDRDPGPAADGIPPDVYDTPIEDLDLTTRTSNCLRRADITKIGQLLQMDQKDLLAVRNLGQKSIDEIREKLVEHNFLAVAENGDGAAITDDAAEPAAVAE